MNGKKARALRMFSSTRVEYLLLKRASHADQGQHAKPADTRVRKTKPAIKPTWPGTPNQAKQSRPLIVIRPARQLGKGKSDEWKQEIRRAFERLPKCECDAAALRGWL